ncbi:gfo/Idh/MocA family oxidoreductase [Paenarthrobacter ureafaciens]|uniref:Gfo/Idh/MocA family oxidoreductase n=1 Tax=Paenarthrobacter ureafaciens TaxID=37931 RepID=A0AAX3EKG5_PAEUR|nr:MULTISPECIES: Gfo/Idh/MocA family oxidoreductase [Paenarthrobacter]NKR11926.1 oxidoreductase [Arthrobacter sp. M5]NKR15510.1 oxidoreductase [Arthrobacter sp. M6]OEH58504.1 oxidoreductase [Arthrobacter sp. D4]OEH64791.1 oxidoreductase [Arthrobacter sp. D2]MDO5863157.1 Gfo/Idh/MocA family oxidoreductase [Paenarthrobacter sp. SD-2]
MSTETNQSTIKVAIAGCGTIGRTHAAAVGEFPELRVTALVDEIPEAAAGLAQYIEDSGATRPATFNSLKEAFAGADVDLVIIATPSGMHIEQALEVLEAGKHVVIEKPLDVNLDRADEILAAAKAAEAKGLVASVISQHRFDPASVVVDQARRAGRFGRLTSAIASVSWYRSQGYYDSGAWRGTWAMDGGGAVMNQGVHTVDLLLWFLGRPIEISARTALLAHTDVEVEDTAVATVTFESGALAVLHATTAAYPGLTVRLQVMGSKGSAVIDNDNLEYFHAGDPKGPDGGPMGIRGGGNQAEEELAKFPEAPLDSNLDPTVYPAGHIRQYRDVLEAIRSGRPAGVRIEDAVTALGTVRALYVSATLGKPVLIADVLAGKYNDVQVRAGNGHLEEVTA